MTQATRLQLMQSNLQHGLAATGDEHRQRLALESLIRNAHFAGVAPLDYIVSQLSQPTASPKSAVTVAMPVEIPLALPTCRKCGRQFKSQTALNGHGEARCRNGRYAGAELTGKEVPISRPISEHAL